jgi:hypothetical protein
MALGAIYVPPKANEPVKPVEPATPVAAVQSVVQTVVQQKAGANAAPVTPDDLLSKVTQLEIEKSPAGKTDAEIDAVMFSDTELRAKLDAIQDPVLREQFINMRKSMMRGVNDKFQEMAVLRKDLEALKQSSSGISGKPKFSANSVEELLQNTEFVSEAQRLTGKTDTLSSDDTLSAEAKAEISKLKSELDSVKNTMTQQNVSKAQAEWNNHHDVLSAKYKNYDRTEIDKVASDLAANRINVTPEYLYRVIHHDDNVRRAYELGRRESLSSSEEKKNATSIDGVNVVRNDSIQQNTGEDNRSFLQRIIATRLSNGAPK